MTDGTLKTFAETATSETIKQQFAGYKDVQHRFAVPHLSRSGELTIFWYAAAWQPTMCPDEAIALDKEWLQDTQLNLPSQVDVATKGTPPIFAGVTHRKSALYDADKRKWLPDAHLHS